MITLVYQDIQLVLPSPLLKDREILELATTIDRAMDGTFHAFKTDPPKTKFELQFNHVNRPKCLEVISFIQQFADLPVTYTDYNGNSFQVAILNDPFEETHVSRSNNSFTLQLEVLDYLVLTNG